MSTNSLFSRAHRPGVRAPKKIPGFLALPGEIRNQIYDYCFDPEGRCEIVSRESRFTQYTPETIKLSLHRVPTINTTTSPNSESKHTPPTTVRFSRRLGKYSVIQGLQTNWSGSLCALSLVCKQIYTETATLLYQKTTFVFDAPKRIVNFLKFASSAGIGSITKLHLHYDTYGHPWGSVNVIFEEKHRQSWLLACRIASNSLTNLRELEIWVKVNYGPLKFTLREEWLQSLLQFRRLACSGKPASQNGASPLLVQRQSGIQVAKVHIQTGWTRDPEFFFHGNVRLTQASNHLHQLYGEAIALAITGATEEAAMAGFNAAWEGEYAEWQDRLRLTRTGSQELFLRP